MSNKLTALTAASLPLAGTELVYVVQGGNSRSAPVSSLINDNLTAWSAVNPSAYLNAAAIAAAYQPIDSDLTSWAAITRAGGYDTFAAVPSSANLKALVTDETGSGALVFANSPSLTGTATFTKLQYQKTISAFANVPLYLEDLNAQQAVGDAGQMLLVYAQALNQSVVPSDFRLIHNGVTTTLIDSGAMRAVAYQLGVADSFTANTQAAHIRAGEFHALRGAGVPDGGKVWALELGVHSEVAAASAQTLMGIYLASSHTGWRPTGVRSGTGILITGEDGWQHGLTYLDTDQTTVLFDIDQNGALQTKGAIVPTVSGAAALGSASKPWSDLFIKANGTINFGNSDVQIEEFSNSLNFVGAANGFAFETAVLPTVNDGAILGHPSYGWSDFYLASGAVIDLGGGNYKLTHSAGVVTANGVFRVNLNTAALPAPSTGTVLHLSSADGVSSRMTVDNFANAGNIVMRRANTTAAAPSALAFNDAIGGMVAFGYGATGYSASSRVGITMYADAAWSDTAQQTRIDVVTTPSASVTPRVTASFKADGTFDALTALSVNGTKVVGARDTGWTAATGTALKTAWATYAGQTHTGSYVQATVQALDNACRDATQRIKAVEDMLRTHGAMN